jgi:hypothetical protein
MSVLKAGLRDQIAQHRGASVWSDLETERILLAAASVGQHVFARQVLANCGSQCVFCGLQPAAFVATRMLLAGSPCTALAEPPFPVGIATRARSCEHSVGRQRMRMTRASYRPAPTVMPTVVALDAAP